jgi:hypothetical protein
MWEPEALRASAFLSHRTNPREEVRFRPAMITFWSQSLTVVGYQIT